MNQHLGYVESQSGWSFASYMHCPGVDRTRGRFPHPPQCIPRHPWLRAPVADDRQRATRLRRSSIRERQGASRQN